MNITQIRDMANESDSRKLSGNRARNLANAIIEMIAQLSPDDQVRVTELLEAHVDVPTKKRRKRTPSQAESGGSSEGEDVSCAPYLIGRDNV